MGFTLNVKRSDCSHQETINTREMKASTLPVTVYRGGGLRHRERRFTLHVGQCGLRNPP